MRASNNQWPKCDQKIKDLRPPPTINLMEQRKKMEEFKQQQTKEMADATLQQKSTMKMADATQQYGAPQWVGGFEYGPIVYPQMSSQFANPYYPPMQYNFEPPSPVYQQADLFNSHGYVASGSYQSGVPGYDPRYLAPWQHSNYGSTANTAFTCYDSVFNSDVNSRATKSDLQDLSTAIERSAISEPAPKDGGFRDKTSVPPQRFFGSSKNNKQAPRFNKSRSARTFYNDSKKVCREQVTPKQVELKQAGSKEKEIKFVYEDIPDWAIVHEKDSDVERAKEIAENKSLNQEDGGLYKANESSDVVEIESPKHDNLSAVEVTKPVEEEPNIDGLSSSFADQNLSDLKQPEMSKKHGKNKKKHGKNKDRGKKDMAAKYGNKK